MGKLTVSTFTPRQSRKNIESFRRESSFYHELALIDLDKRRSVVNVRFYGPAATVYCVAWFHLWDYPGLPEGSSEAGPGMGKAGGYGYHKASAAMEEAFKDAGVTFSEGIGGRGDGIMCEALEAFAAHIGLTNYMIHSAHA